MTTRRTFINQAVATGVLSGACIQLTSAVQAAGAGASGQVRKRVRGPAARITSAIRREETVLRLGGVGDNWHMSWAANDVQYVSLCDGFGWPGMPGYDQENQEFHSRLYALRGSPSEATFEYLPGYPQLVHGVNPKWRWTGDPSSYYNVGTLALNGRIYQYLSALNHPLFNADLNPWPDARFIGSKLIYSPDNGNSWRNQDGSAPVVWESRQSRSRENMMFFEESQEAFSLLSVLQMGRNYEANRDGYVYIYAPNGNTEGTMNELVMARVSVARILQRNRYEFFAGLRSNGAATWTRHIDSRAVVHTFPRGWVNKAVHPWAWIPSVAYNAALGLYMMVNWGTGLGENSRWFGKPSYLGLWISPHPWGPWTQIHEESAWMPAEDAKARAYSPIIAPKWIAEDGKSFWLVWSDIQSRGLSMTNGDNFNARSKQRVLPYYAFNAQRIDLTVA